MLVSLIVTTYKRFDSLKEFVHSARGEFASVDYEIVVVSSDPENTPKIKWCDEQADIKHIKVADRQAGSARQRSLYFYENLGISASSGEWILIANDDSKILPGTLDALTSGGDADILVAPTEIGNAKLGKQTPIVGTYMAGTGAERPVYLLDFAFFRSSALREIGPADEGFDWYGRGPDMGVRAAILGLKVDSLQSGGLQHDLVIEASNPPHPSLDFTYLEKKWSSTEVIWHGQSLAGKPQSFYVRVLWPIVSKFRRGVLRILGINRR